MHFKKNPREAKLNYSGTSENVISAPHVHSVHRISPLSPPPSPQIVPHRFTFARCPKSYILLNSSILSTVTILVRSQTNPQNIEPLDIILNSFISKSLNNKN